MNWRISKIKRKQSATWTVMFISSLNFRKVFTVLTKACSVVQYICKVNINVFTCQIFIYITRYCIFIICGKMKMLKIVNNLYIRMRLKCKFFWIKNNLFNKIFTKKILKWVELHFEGNLVQLHQHLHQDRTSPSIIILITTEKNVFI